LSKVDAPELAADDLAADAADGAYHCAGHRSSRSFRGYVSMLRGHCQIWGVSGLKRSIRLTMKRAGQSGLIDLRVIEEQLALRFVERH
jgi:hypothetical protein